MERTHSERLVGGIGLPRGQKWHFTRPKMSVVVGAFAGKCPPYRSDANGSGFARIVVTRQQNSLGYDNEVRLTRHATREPDEGSLVYRVVES